jgi:peptidoglycan/LPS O-acetylase OafA/YrhL
MVFMGHVGSWLNNIMADSQKISPISQNIYDFVRLFPIFGSDGGGVGVDIFFMLSGFLIFMTIHKNNPSVKTFFKNRLLRLMPVHVFLIGTILSSAGIVTLLLNLFMIVDFFPTYQNLNLVSWTLSYELVFYILAAIWFILFRKSSFLQSWTFLILLSILLFESQWVMSDFFSQVHLKYPDMNHFIAFLFGVALAKLFFNHQRVWGEYEKLTQLTIFPAIFVLILLKYYHNSIFTQHLHGYFWKSILTIGLDLSIFLILARILMKKNSIVKKILGNRYVRIIGVISYSMYLYHFTFALPTTKSMLSGISSIPLKMILFIPASLFVSLIGSTFLFHFLEKPYFLRKMQ